MNTRLQVEHPVTEAVTGLDLVALQLKVAAGERLPFAQGDVDLRGHAIEVRINAEDPAGGRFLPAPGTITRFRRADGIGVRTDAGYEEGDVVSQYYDNLVAKLIVWGADREEARRRMLRALRETEIQGIPTTIPADIAILEHPDFIAVQHATAWVEQRLDLSSLAATPPAPVPVSLEPMQPALVQREVDAEVNGRRYRVKLWVPDVPAAAATSTRGPARPRPATSAPRSAGGSGGGGSGGSGGSGAGNVTVPMQGTIVQVLVAVGDTVEAGQAVCVLEAMKMENHINAERGGTVTEVNVATGDSVGAGDVVVVIG
jgi:acetyl-CoA/propionyl-CoA carboxylase biotin carboxyl carrier protein